MNVECEIAVQLLSPSALYVRIEIRINKLFNKCYLPFSYLPIYLEVKVCKIII